jgi:UPF0716 protein FxsA
MAFLLFLAFVLVPVVEIALIVEVGGVLGAWETAGLIVLTAAAGTALVRAQGFQVLARAQATLARGEFPAREMADALCLLVAGVLLLTPGFLTDALGLLLLVPWARLAIAGAAWRWLLRPEHVHVHARWTGADGRDGRVIEGEFTEVPPESGDDPRRPPPRRP